MNKQTLLLISLTLFSLNFFSAQMPVQPASAWGFTSHQHLAVVGASYIENVADQLGEYGSRWAQLFEIYESELKIGAIMPDSVFNDGQNHVYHFDTASLQNAPNVAKMWYNTFKADLTSGNYSGAVLDAGIMSHYIIDLCQPMHTDQKAKENDNQGPGGVNAHVAYESLSVNTLIKTIVFNNHTPQLLTQSVEDTTIECATLSNIFYDEIVEAYWNGSFWIPGVEAITTEVLNFGVRIYSNILYTAIKEVNLTLPDFTPLAIKMSVDIDTQITQGIPTTGTILLTDWQNTSIDALVSITRSLITTLSDDQQNESDSLGPFIVLTQHEDTGVYTFELFSSVEGIIRLEIRVSKSNMISKTEIFEITVLPAESTTSISESTSTTTSTSNISTSEEQSTAPSFTLPLLALTILTVFLVRKIRKQL